MVATLIPSDVLTTRQVSVSEAQVGKALASVLPDDAWVWYHPADATDRPRFVALGRQHGLVGIDVYDWTADQIVAADRAGVHLTDGRTIGALGALGQRLEHLRARMATLRPQPPLNGLVALPRISAVEVERMGLSRSLPRHVLISADQLIGDQLADSLLAAPTRLEEGMIAGIRECLYPDTSFHRLRLVCNEGRAERIAVRVQLDAAQEDLARGLGNGITIVRGVAGSGKTLVLAARARYLAATHPEWHILVLCFNRSLVAQVVSLIGPNCRNVRVATFHSWMRWGIHVPIPLGRNADELARERQRIADVIASRAHHQSVDAILVDEGQDFRPYWFKFLRHTLRPCRGGLLVVVDGAQSIYREADIMELLDRDTALVCLSRNYRNTRSVGRFALGTVFAMDERRSGQFANSRRPPLGEYVTEGEPVQLVWAESRDEQADFIATEVERLVSRGHASYRDVAVLFTRWAGCANRLLDALSRRGTPCWIRRRGSDQRELDANSESVKLLTVYSAKGLEFPVVFLFAGDDTRLPDDMEATTVEEAARARALYVGMTRATDLLYVTYTRTNALVQRAETMDGWCRFTSYPGDYQ